MDQRAETITMSMALPGAKVAELAEVSYAEKMGDFSLEQRMTAKEFEMLSDLYVAGFVSGWANAFKIARNVYMGVEQ